MSKLFISLLAALIVGHLTLADALGQRAGKIYRVGFLDRGDARTSSVRMEPFWQELCRLGWVEGTNLTIESRFADNAPESRTAEQAAELVRLKVDVIVCASTAACLVAKKATTAVAIVITNTADAVAAGLIASLARPGGNVTGVSGLLVDLNTKRLAVLKDAIPRLTRVGIPLAMRASARVSETLQMKELTLAGAALKLNLVELPTQVDASELEKVFQGAKQRRVEALLIIGRPLFALRRRLVELAAKYYLPAIYPLQEYVDEGGLMYYGSDEDDQLRVAAGYVEKIFKGAKPADLPVQLPTKFEFVINLKAAKQINLSLSPEFLSRANRVIK